MNISSLTSLGIDRNVIDLWRTAGHEELLPVQDLAIHRCGALKGHNILVFSPTSSGKTFVGEMAAIRMARQNRRVIYLVPQKALAEEKFEDFHSKYGPMGIRVVISTRDRREFDPDIIFCRSKKDTLDAARRLAQMLPSAPATQALQDIQDLEDSEGKDVLLRLLQRRIAYHNADLDWDQRHIIEKWFRAGEIAVICSTTTLAMGINLPARNVFIDPERWHKDKFARGEKRLVWSGLYDANDPRSATDCMAQYSRLASCVSEIARLYRFHLAPLSLELRMRRRAEAAIAECLYAAPGRVGAFQDKGIKYSPRRADEEPVACVIRSSVPLLGLPDRLLA